MPTADALHLEQSIPARASPTGAVGSGHSNRNRHKLALPPLLVRKLRRSRRPMGIVRLCRRNFAARLYRRRVLAASAATRQRLDVDFASTQGRSASTRTASQRDEREDRDALALLGGRQRVVHLLGAASRRKLAAAAIGPSSLLAAAVHEGSQPLSRAQGSAARRHRSAKPPRARAATPPLRRAAPSPFCRATSKSRHRGPLSLLMAAVAVHPPPLAQSGAQLVPPTRRQHADRSSRLLDCLEQASPSLLLAFAVGACTVGSVQSALVGNIERGL
ncbi:hypothetical protein BJ912DRAFT_1147243 [Pholiota molesta]|nr:hypothetical protein BJ912DRAFT_1147243 [Pholiota molesta]